MSVLRTVAGGLPRAQRTRRAGRNGTRSL